MFTIKQVLSGGADAVRLFEGRNPVLEKTHDGLKFSFDMESGGQCTIDAGMIYVMNSSGKTVDTYNLSE